MEDIICHRVFWIVSFLQNQKGDGGRDEQVLLLVLLLRFLVEVITVTRDASRSSHVAMVCHLFAFVLVNSLDEGLRSGGEGRLKGVCHHRKCVRGEGRV
jgi:hypothetical protein